MSAQKKKPAKTPTEKQTAPVEGQAAEPAAAPAEPAAAPAEPAGEPVAAAAEPPELDALPSVSSDAEPPRDEELSVVTYSSASSTTGENDAASFESSAFPVQTGDAEYAQSTAFEAEDGAAHPEPPPADGPPPANAPAPAYEPAPAQPPRARRGQETGPEPAAALTADRLLNHRDRAPIGGWRLWLYKATFGYFNVGDSDKVRIQRAFEHRIGVRLGDRTRYVPVLSRKGGVGKTTITTLLGMVLADVREDRIIAMDANPDRGTLSDRSPGRADYTARELVKERFSVDSFAQLSSYVAREGSRLDVLASDTDPAVAQAFDEVDYRAVTEILGRYYSVVLTDSGTGMVHSVMKGTLEKADTVVLVSGGSVDEARLASETLSWLQAHGREDLVERAIVVINMSSGEGHLVNVDQIEEHFSSRVKTVIRIPYDRHLAEGSRVELAELRPQTRLAVTELAALVIDELHS